MAKHGQYRRTYEAWRKNPSSFWEKAADELDWSFRPTKIFDPDEGVYGRWFVDGVLNTCHNCVDRHILKDRHKETAIIYDSPITNSQKIYNYGELYTQVQGVAAVLKDMGIEKGDRVVIYMPMVPQALFAMLACARIGAIHSVVFGGFAAKELATRIEDAQPKAIIAASCGIEPARVIPYMPLINESLEISSHKVNHCLIYQREQSLAELKGERDVDWEKSVGEAISSGRRVPCEPMKATDPLYILYTSGTTGVPKGVVRDNGGHLAALHWSMSNIYGMKPGQVFWAASDVGWVVGHSYIVYAPLSFGCATIVYEGKPVGTPDAGAFWRVVSEHNVSALFTAPTAFRAIKKEDPEGELIKNYDLKSLQALFLAGERADPDTLKWAEDKLNVPVIDHWWQTETGWAICANPLGLELMEVRHGSPTVPMPGYDVQILDDAGHELPAGKLGNIVIKLPLPPSCLPTLWQKDDHFRKSYLDEFPGYYKTADAGYKDEDGYLYIMSRTDDIINVAGHRLSTGGMEEVIASHQAVAECAVIGINDNLKGQIPCGFIVLKAGVKQDAENVEKEVVQLVRQKIGPVAAFKKIHTVARLPKTRSGKILRGTMRSIADNEEWKMPATIDDPAILDEIATSLGVKSSPKT